MSQISNPVDIFVYNFSLVEELLVFDELVLTIPIKQLQRISASQDTGKITNPRHRVDSVLKQLQNIRENASLKSHFLTMYNQCLVLAVSYFGSAVRDLFINRVATRFESGAFADLLAEELEISLGALRDRRTDLPMLVGELVANRKDVSFQDMQSIARTFKRFVGYEPTRDVNVNTIITGQACRHSIVHFGGRIDARLLAQVRDANPRYIKKVLVMGDTLQFSPDEVRTIGTSMVKYLNNLAQHSV